MAKKLQHIEGRIQQHESLIGHIRQQIKPDPAKERQVEAEKKELRDRLNSMSIRISAIENYTQFLKKDQDDLGSVFSSPQKEAAEEQQSTIQMLQNLMLRTRKDIQERFDQQLKHVEAKVQKQLEQLQNWILHAQQQIGDDEGNSSENIVVEDMSKKLSTPR